jgi:hypothetical protein
VNTVNTISVITSCITFNSTSENGPPLALNPILLAGTISEYSKRAINQLKRIIDKRLRFSKRLMVLNLRCPYHAIVIKAFDKTSNPIV